MSVYVRVFLLTLVLATRGGAQPGSSRAQQMPNQTTYLEFGGNGGWLSANFDRKLNDRFTIRVGTGWWFRPGTYSLGDQPPSRSEQRAVLWPVTVNFVPRLASGSAHRLEAAAGMVLAHRSDLIETERKTGALSAMLGYRWICRPGTARVGVYYNHGLSSTFPFDGFRPGASFGLTF